MTQTIKSHDGNLSFFMPDGGGYIFLTNEGNPGTLGQQICKGGGFMGSTLRATEDTFQDVVRRWYRQFRKAERHD